jgi:peptidoglycan/LPS O-acetylase OafA/YrhL
MTVQQRLEEIWRRGTSSRFEMIDGLRALSVLWMIAFHSLFTLGYFLNRDQFLAVSSHWLMKPFVQGHLGVDVFFTISGFLIGHILFTEFKTSHRLDIKSFYLRRAFRLLPAYLFVLAIFAALNPVNLANAWTNVFYVNNFLPVGEQFMVWTWSLAIEGQFYLVFPIVVLLVCRHARRPTMVFGALFVTSFFVRYVGVINNGISLPAPLHAIVDQQAFFKVFDSIYDKTVMRYGSLVIGVLVAWLHVFTLATTELGKRPRTRFGLLVTGLALIFATVVVDPFSGGWIVENFGPAYLASYRNALSLGIALIIFCGLTDTGHPSAIHRLLASPAWHPISQLSYSAYLIHVIVIYAGYQFFLPEQIEIHHLLVFFPIFLIVTFSLSAVLFITIERPFLRWRKKF